MDGFSPETNDPIRGPGTFKRIMRGIKLLLDGEFLPIITAMRSWRIEQDEGQLARFVSASIHPAPGEHAIQFAVEPVSAPLQDDFRTSFEQCVDPPLDLLWVFPRQTGHPTAVIDQRERRGFRVVDVFGRLKAPVRESVYPARRSQSEILREIEGQLIELWRRQGCNMNNHLENEIMRRLATKLVHEAAKIVHDLVSTAPNGAKTELRRIQLGLEAIEAGIRGLPLH